MPNKQVHSFIVLWQKRAASLYTKTSKV